MKTKNVWMFLLLLATCLVGSSVFCSCSEDDVEETPPATVTPPGGNATEEKDTYEYVDLGLPSGTLWATCNVGASKPEEYGDYFAWGETTTKSTYNWSTYKYCNGSSSTITKYCTSSSYGTVDKKTELESSDDAATANWGSNWQMPSEEQYDELINCCYTTTTWTTLNGVYGKKITSKCNGKSIFIPAAGYRDETGFYSAGIDGHCWSRSLVTNYSYNAYELYFDSSGISTSYSNHRSYGRSVRPVCVKVTNIKLNMTDVSVDINSSIQLSATVLPESTTNKAVVWTSNDESIVMVDETGKVTAVAVGTCTITCSAVDGSGVKSTCQVIVGIHEYVDLGLPSGTLWATCNVGANCPEEYGDYFAWGETEPKTTYDWSTYKYCKGSELSMTKYCTDSYFGKVDNKIELEPSDDVATMNWGSNWQMPSEEQCNELRNSSYTNTTWTTLNGVNGRKITSKSNGNSIFLPAAGYRYDASLRNAGSVGYYWSRALDAWTDSSGTYWGRSNYAYYLHFYSYTVSASYGGRCCGQSVRPVRVKK